MIIGLPFPNIKDITISKFQSYFTSNFSLFDENITVD